MGQIEEPHIVVPIQNYANSWIIAKYGIHSNSSVHLSLNLVDNANRYNYQIL